MSNRVTKEVDITGNVIYLDLKKNSLDEWADTILNNASYDRKNMKNIIVDAGYSIKTEAKKLQEIYEKMGEEE